MTISLNRRKFFLGASVLMAATTSHAAESLMSWLSSQGAVTKIFAILQKHLGLKAEDATIVPAFIARLKTAGTESPERLAAFLLDPRNASELEAYVVEEFVVGSNYLFVKAGQESSYKIYPTQADAPN